MEFQKPSSVVSSKKLSNGRGINGKQVYDAAFAGAPKVGSRVEDYREIFGGSAASSIPVLDVPELNERRVVNRRSSKVDYSKIFGGLGAADFAMPYEELFAKPKKARAPDEARFQPAERGQSNVSGERNVPSSETSFHSKDDSQHFNVSYHKTNPGGRNGTNGATPVAKLHAVPGYTRLVDGLPPLHTYEGGKPIHSVLSDTHLSSNVREEFNPGKARSKAVSGPQPIGINGEDIGTIHTELQKNSIHNRSFSHDFSSDAFGIGLGVHQSGMAPGPPPSGLSPNLVQGGFGGSTKSKFWVSRNDPSVTAGNHSPPFLDEEIDANSAAAASAAALRKAIEDAQAKIKIAKELMEKRRFSNGLKTEKLSSSNISKSKNRAVESEETNKSEEMETQEIHQKEDTQKQDSADCRRPDALKTNQVPSDLIDERKSSIARTVISEAQNVMLKSTQMHQRVDQPEAGKAPKEFSGLAQSGLNMETKEELEQAENTNIEKPSAKEFEWSQKMTTEEKIQKPEVLNKTTTALTQHPKQDKVEKELNKFERIFGWNIFANIMKSTKETHHQDGSQENVMVVDEGEGADHILKASFEKSKCESNLNRTCEIPDLEGNKDEEKPRESQNSDEIVIKQGETFRQEDTHSEIDEAPMRVDDVNGEKENEEQEEERNVTEVGAGSEKKVAEDDTEGSIHDEEYYEELMSDVEGINGESQLEEVKENEPQKDNSLTNENGATGAEVCKVAETERIILEMDQSTEEERNFEATQQAFDYHGNNSEAADENNQDEKEDIGRTDETVGHEQNYEELEVTAELMTVEGNEREEDISEEEPLAVDQEDEMEEKESSDCIGLAQVFSSLHGINEHVDTTEAVLIGKTGEHLDCIEMNYEQKQNEDHIIDSTEVCSQVQEVREVSCTSDEMYGDSDESDIGSNSEENRKNFISIQSEICLGNRIELEMGCGTDKCTQVLPCELSETCADAKRSEVASNNEKTDGYFDSSLEERQKPCLVQKATPIEISQENPHQMLTSKEKEPEDKKQVVMETKAPNKKEAKDRNLEKEREKERIAVERAIREARERAFAEAKERAERAAAEKAATEAQKKAASEAPERSEKASTQTSHKSASEKASAEAKLRAERAAVERATAEARERALEKAMSEKTRNKSDKFSSASRDDGTKSRDQHSKGQGPSSSSRYPSRVANNELAERAAKALAEKNMRDLLAQKEQAERNRVAETLDAEVKRWSSGKERNLRALLSTLQHILGPDSGWQAIPVTSLVSTAAVKKAYRKATLCVHPDKLQQRGASIQQKYTCEKVFDLLKEAWNKFSVEER